MSPFFKTAVVLGLLGAVGPFAIDMYLPAMPTIAADLDASIGATQMTLMVYFVAFGVCQLGLRPGLGHGRPAQAAVLRAGALHPRLGGLRVRPLHRRADLLSRHPGRRRLRGHGHSPRDHPRPLPRHRGHPDDGAGDAGDQHRPDAGAAARQRADPALGLAGGFRRHRRQRAPRVSPRLEGAARDAYRPSAARWSASRAWPRGSARF